MASIRKHLFTLRWEREGRRAYPVFERYACCDWPIDVIPNDAVAPTAALLDLSVKQMEEKAVALLPQDCREALSLLRGMALRCRFSPETQGPYVLDDPDQTVDEASLLTWVEHASDIELDALHTRHRK